MNFFISRAGEDREWAKWISNVLEKEGHTTELQDFDFKPGDSIPAKMYRCFYVRLSKDMLNAGTEGHPKKLWMELIASSGTSYLEYEAYNNLKGEDASATRLTTALGATNRVKLDLTDLGSDAKLFFPYTTTLIEIVLEREPTPLADVSSLFAFWPSGNGG